MCVRRIILLSFIVESISASYTQVPECFHNDTRDNLNFMTWDVLIYDQLDLEIFLKNATSRTDNITRCIRVVFEGHAFELDLPRLMRLDVGVRGSFIMIGSAAIVELSCVSTTTDMKELRSSLQPISNVSLVMMKNFSFTSCPVPLLIEQVAVVMIENCVFSDHSHGALSIFNSLSTTVKNCTFQNNTSSSFFTRKPFRGNSGGLSIGFNAIQYDVAISVTGCVFVNNSAIPPPKFQASFQASAIFSGRGGGLSILHHGIKHITVSCIMKDNLFVNNFAESNGGALFYYISGVIGNHTYIIGNNVFVNNTALLSGGAIILGNFGFNNKSSALKIKVTNCSFTSNSATYSGAIALVPSDQGFSSNIQLDRCSFYRNSAQSYSSAVSITSFNYFKSRQHLNPVEFLNCVFDGNHLVTDGAIIDVYYEHVRFDGVNFTNHQGVVLRGVAARIYFHGDVQFLDNTVEDVDGGVLYLLSSSQIVIESGTHIVFSNNTGRLGAAIVVETRSANVLSVFERKLFNPLCFIQYQNTFATPDQWDQVSIEFIGNRAIIGSALYINGLNLCSWYSYSYPYFYDDVSNVLRWPSFSYSGNINTGHINSSDNLLAVQTPAVNTTAWNKTINAYPGQTVDVAVESFDEQQLLTSDSVHITRNQANSDEDVSLKFSPSAISVMPSQATYRMAYSIKVLTQITSQIVEKNFTFQASSLLSKRPNNQLQSFHVNVTQCPPGLVLLASSDEDEYTCQCDRSDLEIKKCIPDKRVTILEENNWAIHVIEELSVSGAMKHYRCPPGYCRCSKIDNNLCSSVYHYDDEDLQCTCDRHGFLCGSCRDGKGFSALLNSCTSCGSINALLIAALVIMDLIVVSVILLCSVSLPSWLYPFLFYFQVAPYVAQHYPVTFSAVQPNLHFFSSAISLYYPYDFCLYNGTSALASYGLRYIPFVVYMSVSLVVYTANRKFKIGKGFRLSWSGLWLLTILIFTDVVNTSVSILNCPSFTESSGKKQLRWFMDGTVECFAGGHAVLSVLAIVALIYVISMIIIVTAVVSRKIKKHWMFSVRDVLSKSFSDEYYWWAPVELLRRLLFIIFIVVAPGNLVAVLLLTMIYVALYSYTKPYRNLYNNLLEVGLLVDLLLQLMITSNNWFKGPEFNAHSQFEIDECGRVHAISTSVALLIPLYYLPLVLLVLLIITVIAIRCKDRRLKNRLTPKGVAISGSQDTLFPTAFHTTYISLDI